MKSRNRVIELWSCCGQRPIEVTINADELTGEAWRLVRCLSTNNLRKKDNGVFVQSRSTNLQLAEAEGWSESRIETTRRMYLDWESGRPFIDWKFRGFHIWPDHKNGPHSDPDPEALRLKALAYIQSEADRITKAGGTTIASGTWNVRLLPEGYGEEVVLLPDEQAEANREHTLRALFGGKDE